MAEKEFRHLIRVANTDLPGEKKVIDSLRNVKGVSFMFANAICHFTKVDSHKITGELSDDEIKKLEEAIKDHIIEKSELLGYYEKES